MKKFWIFLFIALLGGSLAGERMRVLLLKGFDFFWRNTRSTIFSRSLPLREDPSNIPVIAKRLDGFSSMLFVAAGEDHDVKKGDRVIAHDNVYVGHVEQVSSHISTTILASHPGEHFTAWLPVLSAPIDLEGWGSGLLRALVPASFSIKVEDEVWYDARLDAFVGDVISVKDISASPPASTRSNRGESSQGAQTIKGEGLKEILVRHAVNPLMLSSVRVTYP